MRHLDDLTDVLRTALSDASGEPTKTVLIASSPGLGVLGRIREDCAAAGVPHATVRCAVIDLSEAKALDLRALRDVAAAGDADRLVVVLDEADHSSADEILANLALREPDAARVVAVLVCRPEQEDFVADRARRTGAAVPADRIVRVAADPAEFAADHARWARANGHDDHAAFIDARRDLAGASHHAWAKLLEVEASDAHAALPPMLRDAFAEGVVGAAAVEARRAWLASRGS